MVRALGEVLGPGRPRAGHRRQLARTAPASSPTASRPSWRRVDVLHRPRKEGLGPAYLAGLPAGARAAARSSSLEIDCDFSHDPADVPRLIAAADDADLVLGSRYVPGGSVENWGAVRRAISAGGSLYARLLLGVPVRDLTGGFKCFRRAVLEALDLDAIHSRGYAFQIEMTYRALRARLPRPRDPDPLRRPRGRQLEDVALDRARGDLEGAAAPARGARGTPVSEVTDATFEEEVLAGRAGRSSSTSGRRGASRARRSSRSSRRSPPSTGRPRAAEHRRARSACRRATASSRCRR